MCGILFIECGTFFKKGICLEEILAFINGNIDV